MSGLYVIWSIEHNAWWRPAWAGYTRILSWAGRYDQAEAEKIVRQANIRTFNECMIPVDCVEASRVADADETAF